MTGQTDNMDELKAKAQSLGVKGFALFKSEEALQAKIDEAEESVEQPEPKRKKAPKMSVANINKDDREDLIRELEAADPDCKYMFEKGTVTDRELRAKGFERTEHSLQNDIVVRTDKRSFTEYYDAKRAAQTKLMKSVDTEGARIKSYTESPKLGT